MTAAERQMLEKFVKFHEVEKMVDGSSGKGDAKL